MYWSEDSPPELPVEEPTEYPDTWVYVYTEPFGYSILAQNHGEAPDKLDIFLGLESGTIYDQYWPEDAPIYRLEGGAYGNSIAILIQELRPERYYVIDIYTTDGEIREIRAESDYTGSIDHVYIDPFSIEVHPPQPVPRGTGS